jgi:hypothetical protein
MCLACEMDALWFAEMEAAAPGTAGVPPASSPSPRLRGEGRGEGAVPQAQTCGEVKGAGETPAVPGFRCEETGY